MLNSNRRLLTTGVFHINFAKSQYYLVNLVILFLNGFPPYQTKFEINFDSK